MSMKLGGRVFTSSLLMLCIRVVQRGLGLVSTLVLARVLAPNDFGVVAIVAIVIQFFDLLSNVGSTKYLIQKTSIEPVDLHTALSINVAFKLILWVLLLMLAPLAAGMFDRPELTTPLRVASLVLPIGACASPGMALLRRELHYGPIMRLSIGTKFISFSVVMTTVFFFPSFWALIIGDLVSSAMIAIGSWFVHPYRPRFSILRIVEQARFSQWIVYRSIFGFIRAQVDTFVVSRNFSTEEIGVFYIAKSLAAMPASDVVAPAIDPLLSAFSRAREDVNDLGFKIRTAVLAIAIVIVPICGCMIAFPDLIVLTLLGDQWDAAHDILAAMSPLLFTLATSRIFESVCIALVKMHQLLIYNVLSTIFLSVVLFIVVEDNLQSFTWLRSSMGALISISFLCWIGTLVPLNVGRLLFLCLPAFAGSGVGYAVFLLLEPAATLPSPIGLVLASILYLGAAFSVILACAFGPMADTREYMSLGLAVRSVFESKFKHLVARILRLDTSKNRR